MLPSHGTGARFILYELCLLILFVSLNHNVVVLSVIVLMRSAIAVLNTRSNLVTWEGFDSPPYLFGIGPYEDTLCRTGLVKDL